MSRLKPKEIPEELLKAWLKLHEIAYLSEVKRFGNGALIHAFKQHIGKKAIIIIQK